ncbi:radical SAM protein [Fulvivirgaceae bacterium BMA12]|uniref:Radical SAM protein n=1 Tax=Agaribacillus aureus TaxID=3051825 RepID=A0ABT8KYY9_9BACT|nr:radical SAM protein [Fulvivirgaceae bacterium BMA12]
MPTFIEKSYKSILNKKKFIDSWFWDSYTLNPYNGCLFGCIYCDARNAQYRMPQDFENQIIVKKDVTHLLRSQLNRGVHKPVDVIGVGGVTDAYQGAELKYERTRACLEVINEFKFPVHIATKSDLILRDSDLLAEIARQTWCSVSFTIISLDPAKSRFLDGRAPHPGKRLKALSTLKKNTSLQAGVLLMPLVPYVNDDPVELEELVKAVKDQGADYILFAGGISMKNQQATWFLSHLKQAYPDLIPAYEKLLDFSYKPNVYTGRQSPHFEYTARKNKMLLALCEKHKLPYRMPRFIPSDYRKFNYLLAEKMFNEHYLQSIRGGASKEYYTLAQNIQRLKLGINRENLRDVVSLNFPGSEHLVPKLEMILDNLHGIK